MSTVEHHYEEAVAATGRAVDAGGACDFVIAARS